jgi:AraC-like DNA-binding protein
MTSNHGCEWLLDLKIQAVSRALALTEDKIFQFAELLRYTHIDLYNNHSSPTLSSSSFLMYVDVTIVNKYRRR